MNNDDIIKYYDLGEKVRGQRANYTLLLDEMAEYSEDFLSNLSYSLSTPFCQIVNIDPIRGTASIRLRGLPDNMDDMLKTLRMIIDRMEGKLNSTSYNVVKEKQPLSLLEQNLKRKFSL